MWVLLAFSVLIGLMLQFDLLSRLAVSGLRADLADWCLHAAPDSDYRALYQTVVCGTWLPANSFSDALKSTGAIHMVVSQGLHLTLCLTALTEVGDRARDRLKNAQHQAFFDQAKSVAFVAIGAALATLLGFQAPIARATVGLALRELSYAKRLNWTFAQRTVFSGLLCLAVERSFWSSHSLQLAVAGCLGLGFARGSLARCLLAYATTAPLLLPIQGLHPLAGAVSWALTPVFSCVLFPATLLAFAVPEAAFAADRLWHWTEALTIEIDLALFSRAHWIDRTKPFPEWVRWSYVAALAAGALAWDRHRHLRPRRSEDR